MGPVTGGRVNTPQEDLDASTLSLLCAVVVACTTTAVSDGPLPWSDPAAVGMSAQRLEQIPHAMQRYVDEGSVGGIVTMVARRGRLVHWDAVGFRDVESQVALERNDIFSDLLDVQARDVGGRHDAG